MGAAHQDLVSRLKKPGRDIFDLLSPKHCDLIHMSMGISTEAGELLDAIKKYAIYNKPLDLNNIIEELGDLEFFIEGLRQSLNLSREHILQQNIEKLNKRYHLGKYSDQQAQDRVDK